MAQSNKEIAQGIYAAFATGDIPTVLGAFSPEIVWTEFNSPGMPWGGDYHGPDAIVQSIFMKIPALFDDFQVIPEDYLESGDKVITLGQIKVKAKGTGKSFEAPFAHLATFKEGKITRMQIFEDSGWIINALS